MPRPKRNLLAILILPLIPALVWGCNSAGSPAYSNGGASRIAGDGVDEVGGLSEEAAGRCVQRVDLDAMARQVLSLINIERTRVGVSPLTINDELTLAAEDYACTLASEDFFAHVHPVTGEGPADRASDAGYVFFAVGENLAAGQRSAAEAVEGWMNSEDHRRNLLSPEWTETGIGVRGGGTYGVYWVQEFGKPARIQNDPDLSGDGLTVIR